MKYETKLAMTVIGMVPATIGVAVIVDVTTIVLKKELKKRKPENPPTAHGPKVEKIRNPFVRTKVYKSFDDITNRY